MVDLTVIILTKNEEKNIRKCIESFRGVVKRFVIVDSFSDDKTEEICETIKEEISPKGILLDFYKHEFVNQAQQINWALENVKIDTTWVMRIDADEEVLPELVTEMEDKLGNQDAISADINGIVLKRRLIFMGRWIKHGGRYPEYLLRIWRNGKAVCEQKIMDEHMMLLEGKTITFKNDIQDNNQKSLDWWTSKHNAYSNREVLDHQQFIEKQERLAGKDGEDIASIETGGTSTKQAETKRKVKNGGYYKLPKFMRAHIYFFYRYYIRLGFLDGPEGKIFHFLQAYWYRFLVDAKMYESEKKGNINIK